MHGGLSPELINLDTIRNIPRPCEPLDRGLLIDLLWSDPTNKGEGWFHSIRGMKIPQLNGSHREKHFYFVQKPLSQAFSRGETQYYGLETS